MLLTMIAHFLSGFCWHAQFDLIGIVFFRLFALYCRCKILYCLTVMATEDATAVENGEDSAVQELRKKIADAFDIFDHESNQTVDVREVGTIIRSLGCCPTEGELHDILKEMEEEEPLPYVTFEAFLGVALKILQEKRYKPALEDQLMKAFQVLDVENNGFLTKEELEKYMVEEGEPFTSEELDEMMSTAIDPEKGTVVFKNFVPLLVVDDV